MAFRQTNLHETGHEQHNIVQLFPEQQEKATGWKAKLEGVRNSLKDKFDALLERVPAVQGAVEKTQEFFDKRYVSTLQEDPSKVVAFGPRQQEIYVEGSTLMKKTTPAPKGELVPFRQKDMLRRAKDGLKKLFHGKEEAKGVVGIREHQKDKVISFEEAAPAAKERFEKKHTKEFPLPGLLADIKLLEDFINNPKNTFGDVFWMIWSEWKQNDIGTSTIDDVEIATNGYKQLGVWDSTDQDTKWFWMKDMLTQMGMEAPEALTAFLDMKAAQTPQAQVEIQQAS